MNTTSILLVWIVLSTIGVTLSAYGLLDGAQDLSAIAGLTNGRLTLARTYVANEAIRLSVQALWLIVGAMAWLSIDVPKPVSVTPVLIAIFWGNIALSIKSLIQLRARSLVRHSKPIPEENK